MEFAQVLVVLWRRRPWVVFGVFVALIAGLSTGYRISLLPPGLHPRSLAIGTADTQLLVDTPRSALTDLARDLTSLEVRASVLAKFMTTEPVRQRIAATLGVSPDAIFTEAPLVTASTILTREPTGPQRSNALLGENRGYRLSFVADVNQPTITITAQASRAQDAIRLADGAAVGFISYMKDIERTERIPKKYRATIRQLGKAEGGLVGGTINTQLLVITTAGVLLAWLLLVVIGSSVADNLREIRDGQGPASDQPGASSGV